MLGIAVYSCKEEKDNRLGVGPLNRTYPYDWSTTPIDIEGQGQRSMSHGRLNC